MSDELDINDVVEPVQDELTTLQNRATQLGLKFRSNLGIEKLRALIDAEINGTPVAEEESVPAKAKEETVAEKRMRLKTQALKLVRVRLTCMNPNKKDWPGEIITVGNSFIQAKKYIPFDAEDGYHIPQIILDTLKDRKCQVFVKKKSRNGIPVIEGKLINEFAIEVLPPLTPKELKDLAQRQAMAAGTSE